MKILLYRFTEGIRPDMVLTTYIWFIILHCIIYYKYVMCKKLCTAASPIVNKPTIFHPLQNIKKIFRCVNCPTHKNDHAVYFIYVRVLGILCTIITIGL